MLFFMSSGLILILRAKGAKYYSSTEGGGVHLCMPGKRSPSFSFFNETILITAKSIWKADLRLWSFMWSFDRSEK